MSLGLFDRLTGTFSNGVPVDAISSKHHRVLSIHQHLNILLNCRKGSYELRPDMGVPETSEIILKKRKPNSVWSRN